MKLRWTIVVISCVALICIGLIIWHFVHAELTVRRLAKDAIAYRIRAEQGDAESQFKLGSMYSRVKGLPQDYGDAVRWYRKSAEQGYARAEYNLSSMYRDGKGVPQDYAEAERWCRKAAEQGDARAQEGLGFLFTGAKECHRIMRRRHVGTENPLNKVMGTLNTSSATCITTATGYLRTKPKPTACSTKLPLKATRMLSGPLV